MAMPLRVGLLINAMIGPGIGAGPGQEGYEVAKSLIARDALGKIFCFGMTDDCDLPVDKVVPYCRSWLKQRVLGILNRIHRRYPAVRGRRRIEQWMDAAFARMLTRDAGDVLYCPKPLYPRTIRRAGELGIRVVVETSVLHPRFNLDMVSAERKRLGIHGAAGYTDEQRVRNIEGAIAACDKIFAWNAFVRDSYIRYGVPEDKFLGDVEFAPPGIDTVSFSPDYGRQEGIFTVLHVSSISIIKGVQYLLDAWESLAGEIEGRLLIVGPADRDMRRLLARRKIRNAKWVGRASDPVSYYQAASVFVSPSISDAGPRTVLESMACGVPAIVSDHCGVSRSITSGENGFVYRYDDVAELASLIRWSCNNREKLREMGKRAREMVQGYSVKNYSSEIEQRIAAVAAAVKDA